MKKALILGVSGQDGTYLSKLLLEKGYQVFGASRDALANPFTNLKKLGLDQAVTPLSMNTADFGSCFTVLQNLKPDEIYNLSGQSSVGLSFEQPRETFESISGATLNILECIRLTGQGIRFYNAGSSEIFGDTAPEGASETTIFNPKSPYAIAKATAHWQVRNYREAYGLFGSTGILFNHESPLRPDRYVTKKIIKGAVAIHRKKLNRLKLGNLNISRDWGWAPEYVEAMWLMLQQKAPSDYVVSTGISNTLETFVEQTFQALGLNWKDYVETDTSLKRPLDIVYNRGNSTKAKTELGWSPRFKLADIIKEMIDHELKQN